ncbi:hypothetical protein BDV93DRAFT_519132, partial [Ceratobasidium sp. AG-I]
MANFLDLPPEIFLHILTCFVTPVPLSQQPFWLLAIIAESLLPPYSNAIVQRKQRREQVSIAKSLSLVCRRTWSVFVPFVWSYFSCLDAATWFHLRNACESERELGSYVHHLNIELVSLDVSLPSSVLSSQLLAVWAKLTSLHSLNLQLSPNYPYQPWLAEQLRGIPTLRSLHLFISGFSLGPHPWALPQLEVLSVEIYPVAVIEPALGQEDHDWTRLFNDVVEMVNACVKGGNLKSLRLFVDRLMVDSFYWHIEKPPSLSSLLSSISISNTESIAAPGPSIKQLVPSHLSGLSRLSLTLRSNMGTESFLRAASGLPITDLALHSLDLSLLSGKNFRDFCSTFAGLRRLRLKLRDSIKSRGVATVMEGLVDQDAFVQGMASLKKLEAFKGPVLFRRRHIGELTDIDARKSLDEVVLGLRASRTLSPDLLLQWHMCFDEGYGPVQLDVVPTEPVRLGDWKFASTRALIS